MPRPPASRIPLILNPPSQFRWLQVQSTASFYELIYSLKVRYFVTGGAGFIGSNYIDLLLSDTNQVSKVTIFDSFTYAANTKNYRKHINDPRLNIIKGDICDYSTLQDALEEHDFVVHFAAESHVDRSIISGKNFVETNVKGTYNILEASVKSGIKKLIHVSTDEVYGSLETGSASEASPLFPNSPYSASKAGSDLLARSFFSTYGLNVCITRSCNNYGPNQFPEKVIPVFINSLIEKKDLPIYGTGRNVREWIHVKDNCKGIQKVLEKGTSGEIYNIGSGNHLDNLELADIISSFFGSGRGNFKFVDDRLGHDFRYSVDSSKIKKLGFETEIDFEKGIQETIQWYVENVDWWKPSS